MSLSSSTSSQAASRVVAPAVTVVPVPVPLALTTGKVRASSIEIRIERRRLDSSLRGTGDFRLRPVERPSALLGLAIDVSVLTN